MKHRRLLLRSCFAAVAAGLLASGSAVAQEGQAPPAPVSNLEAADHPLDGGDSIDVRWELSPDDGEGGTVTGYFVYRSLKPDEIEAKKGSEIETRVAEARERATEETRAAFDAAVADGSMSKYKAWEVIVLPARMQAAAAARAAVEAEFAAQEGAPMFEFVSAALAGENEMKVGKLDRTHEAGYLFRVVAGGDGGRSVPVETTTPVTPTREWFDGARFWLAVITFIFGSSVVLFIYLARSGKPLKIRKIAGLSAVDEAVGRATEMGRSVLFVPGILDMNDIQTIAGMTVLSRVAKTAAEYDARVEVPTCRSLVMTTARETVQASFLSAGRPDAYNEDLIYYVTDEQFGYVAYLQGMMTREKPAACLYMGAFFAESLILAETGNSIGAIQVAGTAMPAQLPFFVAACDYTLIGEEFFAASAYLSGEPDQLGSLKGQDVGKVIVGVGIVIGVACATLAVVTGNEAFQGVVDFIRETMLT